MDSRRTCMSKNVMFVVASHDLTDAVVINTDNFSDYLKDIYNFAQNDPDKTVFHEGYPELHKHEIVKLPCKVDEVVYVKCVV